MMKKLLPFLVLALMLLPLLAACSTPEATQPPATTTAPPTTTTSQPDEVIELTWACSSPPFAPPAKSQTILSEKIAELSGGKVKFTFYYGSSVFEAHEVLSAVGAGMVDISDFFVSTQPGQMQLNTITGLPMLGWPEPSKSILIVRDLFEKYPEMVAEYEGVELFCYGTYAESPAFFHTTKKLYKTIDELQGVKFCGTGGLTMTWLDNLGLVPVTIAFEDHYMSLERGMADGTMSGFGPQQGAGIVELLPYHTSMDMPLSDGFIPLVMCPDTYNSLPPDIQALFTDPDNLALFTELLQTNTLATVEESVALTKELGHEYVTLSEADQKLCLEAGAPLHEQWIEEREPKGVPAREVYNEMQSLIEKYK